MFLSGISHIKLQLQIGLSTCRDRKTDDKDSNNESPKGIHSQNDGESTSAYYFDVEMVFNQLENEYGKSNKVLY